MTRRGRICAIDSSCVIALDRAGLVPKLTTLFSRVLVPKAVRKEIARRRAGKDRLRSIFNTYAFFERCNDYDPAAVDVLLVESKRGGVRDWGEVETIAQAAERGAEVVIDDPWGRELAERHSLECHGTLWVLGQFFGLNLISPEELNVALDRMLESGIRLPAQAVEDLRSRSVIAASGE